MIKPEWAYETSIADGIFAGPLRRAGLASPSRGSFGAERALFVDRNGLMFFEEIVQEGFEGGAVFAWNDDLAGSESMLFLSLRLAEKRGLISGVGDNPDIST